MFITEFIDNDRAHLAECAPALLTWLLANAKPYGYDEGLPMWREEDLIRAANAIINQKRP